MAPADGSPGTGGAHVPGLCEDTFFSSATNTTFSFSIQISHHTQSVLSDLSVNGSEGFRCLGWS